MCWLRWVGDSFVFFSFVLVGAGGPHCQIRGRRTGNVPTTNCRFENFRAHFVEHQTKRGNGRAYEKCRSVRDAHPLLFCRLNTVPFVTCITFEYSYEHSFFFDNSIEQPLNNNPLNNPLNNHTTIFIFLMNRYVINPDQSIQDGTSQLLQRVGFTLPMPMSTLEASMHSEGDSRTSKREKIRREAACHQLLEQWNMCQKELKRITQDLMGQLDEYMSNHGGQEFSKDGNLNGSVPYALIMTPDLNNIGNNLDLTRFSNVVVQY